MFGGLNFLDEKYGYIVASKSILMDMPGLLMAEGAVADSILGDYDEDTYFVVKYKLRKR